MKDILGLFLSFAYVVLVLAGAKGAEGKGWSTPFVTRKLVHLLVGSWIIPTFFLFDHWVAAALPPFCFIWINLYLEKKRLFSLGSHRPDYGTVYFPISFVLLLIFFWEEPLRVFACLGALGMAWGDALAALVGKRWGRHRYGPIGMQKSLEGSLAMGAGAFLASFVSLLLFQPGTFQTMILRSVLSAFVATVLESFSRRALDNLTVPLGSAWAGYLIFTRF